jgi:hypothetical protein
MKHINHAKWIALVAVLVLSGSKGEAQVLLNGSFETEATSPTTSPTTGFVSEVPTDWNAAVSTPYVIESDSPAFSIAAEDGSVFVGMQANAANPSAIYQDVMGLTVGDTYLVTAYTQARNDGSAGTFSFFLGADSATSTPVAGNWSEVSFDYIATATDAGNLTIQWAPAANGDIGFVDNVSITDTAATPEPSSLALISTGVLGMAFVGWRRRLNHGMV